VAYQLTVFVLLLALAVPCAIAQDQKFWTVERFSVTSTLAAEVVYDGWTTQSALKIGGTEGDPLARPFVKHGIPGQAAASVLGIGAVLSLQYATHRLHHERVANWIGRLAVTGEGLNCVVQGITWHRK
jgi:hypothetical protein